MKMSSQIISVLLGLFLFSTAVGKPDFVQGLPDLISILNSLDILTVTKHATDSPVLLFADATAEESMTVKVFDPNYKTSDAHLLALLKKVNLESRGYKKEVTTKVVSEPGG